jgi:hypothetical protein
MATRQRDRINGAESLSHDKSSPPPERSTLKSTRMHRCYWTQYSKNKIPYVKERKAEWITFPFSFFISFYSFLLFSFCNVQCSLFEARCANILQSCYVSSIVSMLRCESQFYKFNKRDGIRSACLLVWNSIIRPGFSNRLSAQRCPEPPYFRDPPPT